MSADTMASAPLEVARSLSSVVNAEAADSERLSRTTEQGRGGAP